MLSGIAAPVHRCAGQSWARSVRARSAWTTLPFASQIASACRVASAASSFRPREAQHLGEREQRVASQVDELRRVGEGDAFASRGFGLVELPAAGAELRPAGPHVRPG